MQIKTLRRLLSGRFFHLCLAACLGAGTLRGAGPQRNTNDISADLDRETNLQLQLDKTLGPLTDAIRQTSRAAHRIKARYRAGTPEYQQANELYRRVRQAVEKLQAELTDAVRTVKQNDSGERASRVNRQVIVDLNGALQAFGDLTDRLGVMPTPTPSPPPVPTTPPPSAQPTLPGEVTPGPGLPTPPGEAPLPLTAQSQTPQVSPDVAVQVCNLFVEHAAGLSDQSATGIRAQMVRQIRSRASVPAFGSA